METRTAAAESIRPEYDPTKPIIWTNPNCKISRYFSVAEVTNRDDRRIPTDPEIIANILALAAELDKVRDEWGGPIGVTSWYRPPAINRAVGGVSNSQHIRGSAADVYSMIGRDDDFEVVLDRHWGGAVGFGVVSGRGFTHLDLRGGGWRRGGGEYRWMY